MRGGGGGGGGVGLDPSPSFSPPLSASVHVLGPLSLTVSVCLWSLFGSCCIPGAAAVSTRSFLFWASFNSWDEALLHVKPVSCHRIRRCQILLGAEPTFPIRSIHQLACQLPELPCPTGLSERFVRLSLAFFRICPILHELATSGRPSNKTMTT